MTVRTEAPRTARHHPVEILREHIVALDAAMLVAVTAAEVGAVHRLRTSARRVEASIRLVELLGSGPKPLKFPEHRKQADAVHRKLRKVRQAAGAVRDLDVQTETIWYDAPAKGVVHEGTPGETIRKQAKELRKDLKNRRGAEAEKLLAILKAEQAKVAASLRDLEQALKPASQPSVTAAGLGRSIDHWFAEEAQRLLRLPANGDEEALRLAIEALTAIELHTLRKVAKLSRYMAESAPEGTPLRARAAQFEALQEAGGKWHDWLLLAKLSKRFHGAKAPLSKRYAKHRDAGLAEYRLRLAELLPELMA